MACSCVNALALFAFWLFGLFGGNRYPFTQWLWLRSSSCHPPHFVGNFSVTDSLVVHFVWLSFLHEVIIFPRLLAHCGNGLGKRAGGEVSAVSAHPQLQLYVSIYLTIRLSLKCLSCLVLCLFVLFSFFFLLFFCWAFLSIAAHVGSH